MTKTREEVDWLEWVLCGLLTGCPRKPTVTNASCSSSEGGRVQDASCQSPSLESNRANRSCGAIEVASDSLVVGLLY